MFAPAKSSLQKIKKNQDAPALWTSSGFPCDVGSIKGAYGRGVRFAGPGISGGGGGGCPENRSGGRTAEVGLRRPVNGMPTAAKALPTSSWRARWHQNPPGGRRVNVAAPDKAGVGQRRVVYWKGCSVILEGLWATHSNNLENRLRITC